MGLFIFHAQLTVLLYSTLDFLALVASREPGCVGSGRISLQLPDGAFMSAQQKYTVRKDTLLWNF